MRHTSMDSIKKSPWSLIPLIPEYIEAEHSGYVSALKTALEDDEIRNIALSGNYGVGKSSILRKLGKLLSSRVVELSLSTLAPIELADNEESVPIPSQAMTPTNRIQQEIVKQLLYRENPSKTPASRFRRIRGFQWWREAVIAVLLGFVGTIVFLLTGWTDEIAGTFTALNIPADRLHLVIWVIMAIAILTFRRLFYGKIRIKQFSAGAATVTLDDNSVSYFDQYLDEIIYFFAVSNCDVVIFEDIDRFNDSHIFETLRALNALLNASPQVKKPIRFIYAIKDSIFDRIGLESEGRHFETSELSIEDPVQAEVVRANRTKFFDLVIPVVPFITHRSARNLATQLLGEIEHEVEPELLDLAMEYLPDMRLLKNIRNEFIVFRDRIFSGDGGQLDLSETELFAMMLYKSTHLTDFEMIRLGKSNLDTLYELSRKLVADNIKRVEGERRKLANQLTEIDGVTTRSRRLGESLLAHVKRVAVAIGCSRSSEKYQFEGDRISVDELKSAQFWKSFVYSEEPLKVELRGDYSYQDMSFTRDYLAAELGDPLNAEEWDASIRDKLNKDIEKKTEDIKFLRSADVGELVGRPDFHFAHEGQEQSLASIAEKLLKSGLAYRLVRSGYLNRNFTLYTSTFHGDRVSPAATNFIIHHIERDLMDVHFELGSEDVDAVIRERGRNALKDPAIYNIAILDRILETDEAAADIMILSLDSLGERQTQFLQAYLTAGAHRLQLIQKFTKFSSQVLIYLVNIAELDKASLLELMDVALANLPLKTQRTDKRVIEYLRMHYAEFSVLITDGTPDQTDRVGELFAKANIKLPRLAPLSPNARSSFISRSLYDITHENLAIAIKNEETVALDVIRAANETVYDYLLKNMGTYLRTVEGISVTVNTCEQFVSVLEDLLEQGDPRLVEQDMNILAGIIEHAAPACHVSNLSDISEHAWSALALHQRFPATFDNVRLYVDTFGVDENLALLLSQTGAITEVESVEEDKKSTLATKILASQEVLPDATTRANLVASLELVYHLDIQEIAAEKGNLFTLLLKHNIIEDTAESYDPLVTTDWPTRRAFILESKNFVRYMTPKLVEPDLMVILADDEINESIKRAIVEGSVDYLKHVRQEELNELARLAVRYEWIIPPGVLLDMAKEKVITEYMVSLLEPHLKYLKFDELTPILEAMGGAYSKLTNKGLDRPHVANTQANKVLLNCLKRHGIVSSYNCRDEDVDSPIMVYKKHE